ncbi:MAG: T9SS type A sorting domain-containing protein [Bacteroidia bacterium]|nr:T9SS type A sorting domain-containing protein [Bacteroidia bacterium]
MTRRISLMIALCFCLISVSAQPNYVFTDIAGAFGYYPLSDLGTFRQYSVTAGGTHTDEWAFLVNNNFGSCGAPACAVWRHYTPGGSAIPFNTVIQPNPGSNYGALYNDNTSGAAQGSASFLQTTTNGNTYTFNFVENGAANSFFSVLETSFAPTNLSGTVTATTGGTITVTGLPPGLNPGEVLYCRYSTNGFATSSLLPVTVAGTTGTVQIPPATLGTVVNYYFYTTNNTPSNINADVTTYGQQAHDLSTLRVLNNAGSNYTFTFGGPVIVLASTGTNTNATVYPTLKAAFDVINLAVAHTGIIQIWINGNTIETATADLTTAASFTSMTINPSGGALRTVSGTLTAPLVRMTGADNVTIDGLNTNGNALTFENTQNAGGGITTITYRNDASNHILRNSTIKGSTPTATSGVILIDNGAGTTGNDNITIQNNIITNSGGNLPTNGIYAGAIASVTINNNIQILGNNIFDYYNPASECGGVNLVINNQDCIISGNHIYQTAARTTSVASSVFTGIDVQNNSTDNITISGNFIGGSGPNCSGAPLTLNSAPVFRGIKCNGGTVTGTSIQGNTVSNILINTTSTSTAQSGISLVTGTFFVGNTAPNTISNITINYNPTTASTGTLAGISTGSGTAASISLANNIIKGITANTTSGRSINIYGINTLGTAGTYSVSGNQIGGPLASDSLVNRTTAGIIAGIRLTLNDPVTHSVSGNLVSGLQGNVAGITAISLTGGGSTFQVLNNTVKRLKNKAIGTGNINGIFYTGTTPSVRHIFNGNIVDSLINISTSTLPTTAGFNINLGGVANFSLKNNTVRNINSLNGQSYGVLNASPNVLLSTNDTLNNNIIRNIFGAIAYGMHISTTSTTETSSNYIAGNSIDDLRATTTVGGIYKQSPAATNTTILNNTIDSLSRTGTLISSAIWSGIYLNQLGLAHQATVNGNTVSNILINSAPVYGIYLNPSNTGHFLNTSVNNNILNRLVVQNTATAAALNTYGISISGDMRGITMNQNTFRNIINGYSFVNTALNTAAIHINCPAALLGSVFTISQNDIFNIENTQTNGTSPIAGIYINLPASATLALTRNNIRAIDLQTTNTAAPIYGFFINNASGSVTNNMIRLGHTASGSSITRGYGLSGISVQSGNCTFYHNSIYIGGTGVASAIPTSCFSSSSTLGNVRNNIFMNARSNAVPSAIYNHAISLANASVTSNYNLYYTTGTDGATGFLAPSSYITLCDWKVVKVSETNSLWGNPNFNNATGDTALVNLHIVSPSAAESAGLAGLSTIDFDNDPRNATTPDLGADEANVLADIFAINYTIGVIDSLCVGAGSFSIPYVIASGSPTLYSLSNITAMPGFTGINNAAIPASPIPVSIPVSAAAGNYDFEITFYNTEYCISKKDTLTLTIESYPVLTITDPAAVCNPNTVDITAPAVTAGSSLPSGTVLSYWTNAGATSSLSTPSAVNVGNTYYIKAETGAGCADINPVVVTINPTPALVITDPAAVCSPATVDITAAAVTAGSTLPATSALTYWNDFAATNSLSSPSAVATSGNYYIKAETGAGCSNTDSVFVLINPSPILVITDPSAVCNPATVDITAAAVTAGSTLQVPNAFSYWNDFAATISLPSPAAVAASGTYFIKAENDFLCSDIDSVHVLINPTPALVITDPATVCSPATVNITVAAITAGSTLPATSALTYWNDLAATSSLPSPSAVATTGTYFIKAETGAGCADIDSVHVVVNPTPGLVITDPAAVCSPATVDITAAAVTAGSTLPATSALTYWNDLAATSSLPSPSAVATTGTYFIKAETGIGCADIDSVHVMINPTPALVITDPAAVCSPATVNITAAAVTAGSTLPATSALTYWNDLAATSSLPSPSAVATTGTYFIKAETGAGCSDIDSVHVVVNATPATPPTTTNACTYLSITGSVTLTASGSGGTIEWYDNSAHTGTLLGTGGSLNVSSTNTYYAFIVNPSGCYTSGTPAVANIRTNPSTNIPSAPGNYWATHAVPQGTWTHYCICEDDFLLLSLELNGQNIGDTLVPNTVAPGNASSEYSVNMNIIPGNSVHIPATVPYVNTTLNPNGWWVFPRTWDVYPNTQPSTPVGLRHYYKDVDFINLNADIVASGNTPIPSESDLTSYKLVGFTASTKLGDQHNALTTNDILLWGNPFYYLAPWTGGTNSPSYPNVHYIQHNVASFSGGGAGGGGNGTPPLPLTLLGFDGKNEGSTIKLNWLTQNEYNMSHFEVERSKDQLHFDYIGQEASKGSAFPQNGYNFTDEHPFNDMNYYRLKMVSIDGTHSYSPTIAVSMNSTLSYSLYPNPAQNTLYLDLMGGQNEWGLFEIFNAEGQSVIQWQGQVSEFLNLSFDVSNLAKGIYFYQIKYDKESLSGKCVIE